MADKCAVCGESLELLPDGNGSYRYYSGDDPETFSATCVKSGGEPKTKGAHVVAVKEKASTSDKGGTS